MSGNERVTRSKKTVQVNPPVARRNTPTTKEGTTLASQQKTTPKLPETDRPDASTSSVNTPTTAPEDPHIPRQESTNTSNETINPPEHVKGTTPPTNNEVRDGNDGRIALTANSNTNSNPNPYATCKEKYLNGFLNGKQRSRRNVIVGFVKGRGRSGLAKRNFKPGDFVCEYEAIVRRKETVDWGEKTNAELGLGCYCLDVVYNQEAYTFDATSKHNAPGRYINHARKHPNLLLKQPVMIGKPPHQRLRIGLVAKGKINRGEEQFFDYGIRDKDIPWLKADAKLIGTTFHKGKLYR